MARIEVVCPFCKAEQHVPEKRLREPWVCMKCRGTIDDPFLNKKKSPPPRLQIPLHGKIISASGITNLSEIVAASEDYSKGFDPSTVMIPGSFNLEGYQTPVYVEPKRDRSNVLMILIFAVVIVAGLAAFVWLVIVPMTQ